LNLDEMGNVKPFDDYDSEEDDQVESEGEEDQTP
jgi:hypothetical protein